MKIKNNDNDGGDENNAQIEDSKNIFKNVFKREFM